VCRSRRERVVEDRRVRKGKMKKEEIEGEGK